MSIKIITRQNYASSTVVGELMDRFDFGGYFNCLKTVFTGQKLLFHDETTSTFHMIESFMDTNGFTTVANVQTAGRGRTSNKWTSHRGCAMFCNVLHVDLESFLGQRISFLQMLMSLAIVKGIKKLLGGHDIGLRLKWPNDIYYGRETKVGGIIVTSLIQGNKAICCFGSGINVDNLEPTNCINNIIRHSNLQDKKQLTTGQVIGASLTELESMVNNFRNEDDWRRIKKAYLDSWLHQDQKVTTADSTKAIIREINDYGFLVLEEEETHQIITAQPDGNRFDLLQNLLILRETEN
ncbi:holocarboxylase synthetase-like protein [Brevipalpus obovatus]|uniref:holocarboxylase synthetase-like protein n=1 Tax=Brevipalpus obovatus TaxID=246614 RepID=UPI003D9F0354